MPHLPGSPVWQRDSSHSTVLDYHLSMLHDTARMESFRRAIDASVQPGDVVVDIGCGSGVLSFMACEAGAMKVYAIEGGPVIEVARELAVDNMPQRTGSSWSHGFLPLAEPMVVSVGDQLSWELSVSADGEHWGWHVDRIEG